MGAFPFSQRDGGIGWRAGRRGVRRDPERGESARRRGTRRAADGRGGRRDRGDGIEPRLGSGEQAWSAEARVPRPALGVQDRQFGIAARRAVAVPRHRRAAALPHHVAAQPDPAGTPKFEPKPARLVDGGRQSPAQTVRREHDEQGSGAACEGGEAREAVADPDAGHRRVTAIGKVEDEQVRRPSGEERACEREPLLEVARCEDHEPLGADAARHGLDGVECPGEVEPGHDRPSGLRLCGDLQGERGSP